MKTLLCLIERKMCKGQLNQTGCRWAVVLDASYLIRLIQLEGDCAGAGLRVVPAEVLCTVVAGTGRVISGIIDL